MNKPDRILVFIPTYNCAPQIGRVLAQFQHVPPDIFEELLVVDNHSKDGTLEAAFAAAVLLRGVRVKIVRNVDNYGLGGSHKSAFEYAAVQGYTHVVVLHGDDQGNISDIVPLLTAGIHNHYDCCLGSRFASGSKLKGYALTRIIGNYVFNALFSLVALHWITDLGSGLNVFSRAVFDDKAVQLYSDDLRFNCYLLLGLCDSRRRFQYFPISWEEEDQVSNVKIVSQSLRTLKILAEYMLSRGKFRKDDHRDVQRLGYPFDVLAVHPITGETSNDGDAEQEEVK
jgi:dolichol-phosphate mannosyltransferase